MQCMHGNNSDIREIWNADVRRDYLCAREQNIRPDYQVRIQVGNEREENLVVWNEGTLEHLDTLCTYSETTDKGNERILHLNNNT